MKHLKKDDGYVLVYVLIVFTILSLVAVSICNVALRNLQAQKADVARMEARYVAEGELQKFVAELTSQPFEASGSDSFSYETAEASAKAAVMDSLFAVADGKDVADKLTVDVDETENRFYLQAISGPVQINSTMAVDVEWELIARSESEEEPKYHCTYAVKEVKLTYESYDISYEEVAE